MKMKNRNILIAIVVVILIVLLYWARNKCHLGKYSRKGCPNSKGSFYGLTPMDQHLEYMQAHPVCAPPHPAAISEARSLQHANALLPGSPYYSGNSGGLAGNPNIPEATSESHPYNSGKYMSHPSNNLAGDVDDFAARQLVRDKAAYSSTQSRSNALRSNPAQVTARQARFSSMREGFGAPTKTDFS